MAKGRIQKVGNSAGVVLRKDVLSASGLQVGDEVTVEVNSKGAIEVSKADAKRNRVRQIIDHNHKRYAKNHACPGKVMGIVLPEIEHLIEAHELSIQRFGGELGVRSRQDLEAALERPLNLIAYAQEDAAAPLHEVAASLSFAITKIRHPFVDGNKRAGFDAIQITLGLNGFYLDASEQKAEVIMIGVADGTVDEATLADWIDSNSYAYVADDDPFVDET